MANHSAAKSNHALSRALEAFAQRVTVWVGSSWAFTLAAAVILVWAVTGPLFHYSDTWQLVINTGTTIVTFLMVFLIQRSQNKEALAVQLKLNEIVAALKGASNRLINVEDLSEDEVRALHERYQRLAELALGCSNVRAAHSIEEAERELEEAERELRGTKPPAAGKAG
jgi:low affinity Fe/Cu permease